MARRVSFAREVAELAAVALAVVVGALLAVLAKLHTMLSGE